MTECETCNRKFKGKAALRRHLDSAAHTKPCSMHPSLHDDVSRLLEQHNLSFEFHRADEVGIKLYDTNIKGQFVCNNRACSTRRWSSLKIAISIRLYHNNEYNAVVWHQRCKSCESTGHPILDSTYAERITYRLSKWSGVELETPPYSGERKGRPHQSALCEGCKNGHCAEGARYRDYMT